MAEDDDGHWWIATDIGVLRIPAGELDRAVANPAYRIRYESFNLFNGLPGMPQGAFPVPVVARTRDGRIWFATNNGIAYVDPRRIPRNDLPPPVLVETVKVDNKVLAPANGIVLTHDMKDIEIDYTALSLSIPERVLFRYKLEGNDTEWQEPGTRRQAFYNGLRPRKYKFRVIACNDDGVWNEEGATLDFRVAPAWYQTIWFRASCVAGFVLLLWALYQLRLQHLQRQFNMTLEARVGERTRIARELHDTLIQSVDGLMLRIETALTESDPKRSRLMIEKALDSADEVMLEGRQRVNALRAEATAVKELSEALASYGQDLSKDHPATFSVALLGSPKAVDAFVRDEAYCIGREALGNAFQHADATKIELEVTYDRRVVHMRVRDDGYGIDEQTLTGGRPGHWGLRGMRERAQVIGGKLVIWSRPGVGTEIDLEIPADLAYEKGVRGLWSYWMKRLIGDRRVME
jgi:signal transduction histidine kinase